MQTEKAVFRLLRRRAIRIISSIRIISRYAIEVLVSISLIRETNNIEPVSNYDNTETLSFQITGNS